MPWKYHPSSLQLPESSPIAPCCLRCAKQLGANPGLQCTRSHAFRACEGCDASRKPCKAVPVFLQAQVEALREIEDTEERVRACERLVVEAESVEKLARSPEDEGNRLLRSLNRNVFRLVQLQRLQMALDPLGADEEEVPPVYGGGRVV